MPEHDNDKLENFFRKAASNSDVTFNEEDWKKLEARLDATDSHLSAVKKTNYYIAGALILSTLLIVSSVFWLNSRYADKPEVTTSDNAGAVLNKKREVPEAGSLNPAPGSTSSEKRDEQIAGKTRAEPSESVSAKEQVINDDSQQSNQPSTGEALPTEVFQEEDHAADQHSLVTDASKETSGMITGKVKILQSDVEKIGKAGVEQLDNEKIYQELIQISPAIAEKIKQKVLPGAEEEGRLEADAIVKEADASGQEKHLAASRLSLLLSLAPDFSSTSFNQYTGPGEAFGAMIHYHVRNVWSISAGVVKSNKRYTGDGDDYQPPKGYWKYYTNGIIPYSIDGACSVLEFPIMLQYTVATIGKGKLMAGAGASSYIMLDESYRYHFEQPNPGAKDGWESRNTSRFLFNMINFTVGYERQILSGLMIGIEPYVKIPIEEIGWSNLKLFSTGASLSLRYSILGKRNPSTPTRSRGPD